MLQQTKGYFRLKGRIWGLNNKKAYENGSIRSLSIGLQTSKENSLFLQVGEWKNSTLNVKVKGQDMEEVVEVREQDAIDLIKETFKDGDSVYINCRPQVNTYKKRIDYVVGQIYIEKEAIDFDSSDFAEVNELVQSVVITEKPTGSSVMVGLATYKGELLEQELALKDVDVKDYFSENVKVGDLMRLTLAVRNIPIYEGEGEATERKTLKGKNLKSGGKKIVDRKLEIEVIDVDIDATKSKEYDREEIREAIELAQSGGNKVSSSSKNVNVEDEDMPY